MISRSMVKTLALALVACIATASVEAKVAAPTPTPSYEMSLPVLGSGGTATNADYELISSYGQWDVELVKLTSDNGYSLDGGMWANLPEDACYGLHGSPTKPKPTCP